MAPLPPIWDPAKAQDRLPQPYRMIDKVLAEIVEKALDTCLAKEKQKRVIDATHIDTVQHHIEELHEEHMRHARSQLCNAISMSCGDWCWWRRSSAHTRR
jgi:hypothetical protein